MKANKIGCPLRHGALGTSICDSYTVHLIVVNTFPYFVLEIIVYKIFTFTVMIS